MRNWYAANSRGNENVPAVNADNQGGARQGNAGPTIGGFSYAVTMGTAQSYDPEWSKDALMHQEILENAYWCLLVLIGVFSPFFKQVCCYAPLWRKQVPYNRLEFFLALQNCCNKP